MLAMCKRNGQTYFDALLCQSIPRAMRYICIVVVELLYSKEGPVMHKFHSEAKQYTPAAASQF